ncbi:29 kDa ribonucleoprotein A, chloroplastic-like protein [Tanacetum coccineum]|uniref:29 kDa ribonucleoprotein A, chloroplastic-like protein n=1 Tax=Tanacetum coccineum TaxID=301880 RepID=A0ABQ5CWN4_9ASTR
MLLNHSNRAGARTFTRQTAAHHRGPHCCALDAQPIHLRDLNGQQPAASTTKDFLLGYIFLNQLILLGVFLQIQIQTHKKTHHDIMEPAAGTCSKIIRQVIYYKVSGTSRGFGFVTMSSVEEVEEAIRNFNGVAHANRKRKLMRGRYKLLKWMCLGDEMGVGLGRFWVLKWGLNLVCLNAETGMKWCAWTLKRGLKRVHLVAERVGLGADVGAEMDAEMGALGAEVGAEMGVFGR